MRQPELAYTVTDGMVHQILERGAVGTISELLDAAPRPGESAPRLSGTFSQAWSLAEFLRTTYRSYLGVRVDATSRQVWLRPRLPKALEGATFDLSIGDESIRISYAGTSRVGRVTLTPRTLAEPVAVNVTWTLPEGQERSVHLSLPAQGSVEVSLASDNASAETSDGTLLPVDTQIQEVSRDSLLASCTLATPRLAAGLRSLLGPSYELLPHPTIKADPASAQILVSVEDPEGDDRGPGTYTYPSTTHLRPGSLDLTGFTVKSSDSLVHFELTFRALSNPGWHPEYGFQLTFAAIAVDTDGAAGSGRALVERNARYRLKRGREYERIIFVGGGVQIEDAAGTILGAYMPRAGDERHPLGNAAQGVLSFSVPSRMLGTPSKHWRYTVLVGAQDDHGGAGLGEFRSVEKEGGEWIGGGKGRGDEANVYDVLEVR